MNNGNLFYLKATAALKDTFFEGALVFIAEKNEQGATGFVINKLFDRRLNELQEFSYSRPFPMYEGGPVDTEHLFFIHRRPDLIEEGKKISAGLYLGGQFQQALEGINNLQLTTADIKLFIGYCGWNAGELEAEIAEGSWTLSDEKDIFMI